MELPAFPNALQKRYRAKKLLGSGGFGMVVLATDTQLDRAVAIKLLHHGIDTPEIRGRFEQEAQVTALLRHPGIVRVYDHGVTDGRAYIVYEYVEGYTLSHGWAEAPPDEHTLRSWLRSLAEALAAAHEQGIVHRDVKPENIILRGGTDPVLCDFGIARVAQDGKARTAEGVILGTPAYMAPELFSGGSPSAASDQFALAATFTELASGIPVYGSGDLSEILARVSTGQAISLPSVACLERAGLRPLVTRALRFDPSERYPDLKAVAEASRPKKTPVSLTASAGKATQVLPAPAADLMAVPPGPAKTVEKIASPLPRQQTSRRPILVATLLFLLLGIGFVGSRKALIFPAPEASSTTKAVSVPVAANQEEEVYLGFQLALSACQDSLPKRYFLPESPSRGSGAKLPQVIPVLRAAVSPEQGRQLDQLIVFILRLEQISPFFVEEGLVASSQQQRAHSLGTGLFQVRQHFLRLNTLHRYFSKLLNESYFLAPDQAPRYQSFLHAIEARRDSLHTLLREQISETVRIDSAPTAATVLLSLESCYLAHPGSTPRIQAFTALLNAIGRHPRRLRVRGLIQVLLGMVPALLDIAPDRAPDSQSAKSVLLRAGWETLERIPEAPGHQVQSFAQNLLWASLSFWKNTSDSSAPQWSDWRQILTRVPALIRTPPSKPVEPMSDSDREEMLSRVSALSQRPPWQRDGWSEWLANISLFLKPSRATTEQLAHELGRLIRSMRQAHFSEVGTKHDLTWPPSKRLRKQLSSDQFAAPLTEVFRLYRRLAISLTASGTATSTRLSDELGWDELKDAIFWLHHLASDLAFAKSRLEVLPKKWIGPRLSAEKRSALGAGVQALGNQLAAELDRSLPLDPGSKVEAIPDTLLRSLRLAFFESSKPLEVLGGPTRAMEILLKTKSGDPRRICLSPLLTLQRSCLQSRLARSAVNPEARLEQIKRTCALLFKLHAEGGGLADDSIVVYLATTYTILRTFPPASLPAWEEVEPTLSSALKIIRERHQAGPYGRLMTMRGNLRRGIEPLSQRSVDANWRAHFVEMDTLLDRLETE